jgi:histidinol-phosphate aminotransferase
VEYDFSQNLNPLGPPPGMLEDLRQSLPEAVHYPSLGGRRAAEALAQWLGVDPSWVAIGNGSSEIILLVCLAFLSVGRRTVVLRPSYMEYARTSMTVGARVLDYCLDEERWFQWSPSELGTAVAKSGASVVWLGNPHNPTGQGADLEGLRFLMRRYEDVLWVVDEAYVELSDVESAVGMADHGNLLVLRSLTKALALPGVRLGYAVAHPVLIDRLRRVSSPWSLNVLAERLAVSAHCYWRHVAAGAEVVRQVRPWMVSQLKGLGLVTVPSQANFVIAKVGSHEKVTRGLLKKGIMVRDCASLGLPGYLRLAVRPRHEVQILLKHLPEVVG